jgi:phosphatidylglycerol:prolipoprotein diacylglycerol transferase
MYPILARYDSIFIYSFTVVLALGIVLAVLLTARLARTHPAPSWFDALLVSFSAVVAGGRLGFVIGQWSYFQEFPAEILHFSQGGLSYYGALFSGLSALFLWTRAHGRSFYTYAALYSPGLGLILAFGWAACWFDGCAYGRETVIGPLSADLPDEFGIFALRYQTQLVGLLLSIIAFILILQLFRRFSAPVTFWSALLLLSTAHLIPGFLRGDPAYSIGPARLDVLFDLILIATSFLMLQYIRWKQNPESILSTDY